MLAMLTRNPNDIRHGKAGGIWEGPGSGEMATVAVSAVLSRRSTGLLAKGKCFAPDNVVIIQYRQCIHVALRFYGSRKT